MHGWDPAGAGMTAIQGNVSTAEAPVRLLPERQFLPVVAHIIRDRLEKIYRLKRFFQFLQRDQDDT